jgi:hypothetical protein
MRGRTSSSLGIGVVIPESARTVSSVQTRPASGLTRRSSCSSRSSDRTGRDVQFAKVEGEVVLVAARGPPAGRHALEAGVGSAEVRPSEAARSLVGGRGGEGLFLLLSGVGSGGRGSIGVGGGRGVAEESGLLSLLLELESSHLSFEQSSLGGSLPLMLEPFLFDTLQRERRGSRGSTKARRFQLDS